MNGDFASSISLNLLSVPLAFLAACSAASVAAKGLLAWQGAPLPSKKGGLGCPYIDRIRIWYSPKVA